MVEHYRGKGRLLSARLYKASESDLLAQDIAEHTADPRMLVTEYSRVVRAEGLEFPVTVLIVRQRLKVRGDA